MTGPDDLHPAATRHLPGFVTAPGETDVLMVVTILVLLSAVVALGVLYFKLYHLPARYATAKLQYEIVGALALLALLTQMHIFWVAALLLALIEFPDFSGRFARIANSVERIAGHDPADKSHAIGLHGGGHAGVDADNQDAAARGALAQARGLLQALILRARPQLLRFKAWALNNPHVEKLHAIARDAIGRARELAQALMLRAQALLSRFKARVFSNR